MNMPAQLTQPFLDLSFDPIDETCPLQFPALGIATRRACENRPATLETDAAHGTDGAPSLSPVAGPHPAEPMTPPATGDILFQVLARRRAQLDRGHTVARDAADMRRPLAAIRREVQDLCDHLLMQPPAGTAAEGAADRAKLNRIARREAVTLAALAVAVVEAIDHMQTENGL